MLTRHCPHAWGAGTPDATRLYPHPLRSEAQVQGPGPHALSANPFPTCEELQASGRASPVPPDGLTHDPCHHAPPMPVRDSCPTSLGRSLRPGEALVGTARRDKASRRSLQMAVGKLQMQPLENAPGPGAPRPLPPRSPFRREQAFQKEPESAPSAPGPWLRTHQRYWLPRGFFTEHPDTAGLTLICYLVHSSQRRNGPIKI